MHAPIIGSGKYTRGFLHLTRHRAKVVQAVAKAEFHLRQALETVADDVFIGDANAKSLFKFTTTNSKLRLATSGSISQTANL
jgi:hypothetical protein